jgi:glycosyltransferase involved in cell wall biosynthesis
MRIALLTAGAGGMYCGSCLQSNTLAAALVRAGEEALLVPLYMPLRTDEEDLSIGQVAFGGVNVYLRERSSLLGRLGRLLRGALDHPVVLRWAARRSGTTRPEVLGRMTVSMLRGEEGRQRAELARLVDWLAAELRPDVVHLNNVLLVGMAREIRRRLGVPVVASLSGEDVFLEKVPEPHYAEARRLLRERSNELDALVAMNDYFAAFMAEYLSVPRAKIHVVPPGLRLDDVPPEPPDCAQRPPAALPVVGFLARICHDKGLHLLAEAAALLASDAELPPVEFRAAGYLDPADRPYLRGVERRMAEAGLASRFRYLGELDRSGKHAFLRGLDVMCLPTVYRESKGLTALEAWANGVPVVVPRHGAFPEMVEATGGGLLCEPGDPASVAAALRTLLLDRGFARQCGAQARRTVFERYNAPRMAREMTGVYRAVVAAK